MTPYFINKKITQNKFYLDYAFESISYVITLNTLSKAICMQKMIDYLYLCETHFFSNTIGWPDITYQFLESLQGHFNDQGHEIYFDKFINKKRIDGLKRFGSDKEKLFSKRVAVCIYGALRSDWEPCLSELINDTSLPFDADCFLTTWNETYEWFGLSGGDRWVTRLLKEEFSKIAPEEINNNVLFKENFPKTFNTLSKEFVKPLTKEIMEDFKRKNPRLKAFSIEDRAKYDDLQLGENIYFGEAKSLELMKEYERKIGQNYDFIIFTRPDVKITKLPTIQSLIKQKPNLKLPKLETYKDYELALKEKECFTYKLGLAMMKADKTWYKGGYIKFYFEAKKLEREFKGKKR